MTARPFAWGLVVLAVAAAGGGVGCGRKEPPRRRAGTTAAPKADPAKPALPVEAEPARPAASEPTAEPPADSLAALQKKYSAAKLAFAQHKAERSSSSYERTRALLLDAKETADRMEAKGLADESAMEVIGQVIYDLRTLQDYPAE